MNLLPLALGFLAWQFLKKNGNGTNSALGGLNGIGNLLNNPDALGMLTSFGKLSDKKATTAEKTSALIELLSSPAILEVAKSLFKNYAPASGSDKADNRQSEEKKTGAGKKSSPISEDDFKTEEATDESKQFFKPVETVAGVEISKKLYHLYDNWYLKK